MSREKQIDELAKYLCKNYSPYCSMCPDCYAQEEATALYNAGYRKDSEVAREIIEEAEKIFMFTCSSLVAYTDWQNFKKKYTEEGK
jgi:hypothetical protein